jgi:hypothetical protein
VNVLGWKTSEGQVVLAPVHVSSGSQTSPDPVRQTVPALPAGCWQSSLVPSHSSVLHTLPSSVQLVPAGLFASAGQVAALPGQLSVGSHSPAEPRHSVVAGWNASGGHVVLVPVQVSSTSQTPAEARHVAPALPAGCWQASLTPSH